MKNLIIAAALIMAAAPLHAQKKEKWTAKKIDEVRKECLTGVEAMGLSAGDKTGKDFCQCVVEKAQKRIPKPSELSAEAFQAELMMAGADCGAILAPALENISNLDALFEEFTQSFAETFQSSFMEQCLEATKQRYDEAQAHRVCRCILDKIVEKHGSNFAQIMSLGEEEIFKITEACAGE
jgi:hypothetical protein